MNRSNVLGRQELEDRCGPLILRLSVFLLDDEERVATRLDELGSGEPVALAQRICQHDPEISMTRVLARQADHAVLHVHEAPAGTVFVRPLHVLDEHQARLVGVHVVLHVAVELLMCLEGVQRHAPRVSVEGLTLQQRQQVVVGHLAVLEGIGERANLEALAPDLCSQRPALLLLPPRHPDDDEEEDENGNAHEDSQDLEHGRSILCLFSTVLSIFSSICCRKQLRLLALGHHLRPPFLATK